MQQALNQRRSDALPGEILRRPRRIQLTNLTGFRHHEAPRLWATLRRDSPLTLERDPGNTYDPDAVAVCWKGLKLGYLPRGENFVVARLLDGRHPLSARIAGLSPRALPNRRIRVEVLVH